MSILTGTELFKLTKLKQPKAQARCLAKLGIRALERGDGSLAVTEQAVTQAMLSSNAKTAKEPNFGAIK